ncbi:MAG: hypothetical protein Q4P36_06590 [Bowdeniella nasicola]|nr:hypothetical protein [Bowdeniella nasicola]
MSDTSQPQGLIAQYRDLFTLSGTAFVVVGFIARLPLAMAQMGTLLMITAATESYTAGGTCAGALAVANAVGAPLAGALTDRIGQRLVVLVQALASGLLLITLVVLTHADVAWPLLALASGAAGFFLPQIGTLARIRWREIVSSEGVINRSRLNTAFSWEGAGDEASFVAGPAIAGVVTALVDARVAVLVAAGLMLVFGVAFALHPTARLVAGTGGLAARPGRAITTVAGLAIICQFLVGTMFGSIQTGTTVLARSAGLDGMAGLLHSLLGVGSVIAGITLAILPERFGYPARLRVFSIVLFVLATPLLAVHSLAGLALVLAIMGFAIAPLMITNFTVVERVTLPTRLGVVMTILAATTGLGYAAGSSTAGRLADWGLTARLGDHVIGGYPPAFAVTITGALLATAVAFAVAAALTRRTTIEANTGSAS